MINTQIGLIIFFAAKDGEALYSQQKQDWETDWGGNKKELRDPENHDGVIIHLKPDILKCEVKWALGRSITTNKASRGDGIPVELVQILNDDAVKVLHSICQQIWKIQQWPQDWKRSIFIPIPKKGNAKECSNYGTMNLKCIMLSERNKTRRQLSIWLHLDSDILGKAKA